MEAMLTKPQHHHMYAMMLKLNKKKRFFFSSLSIEFIYLHEEQLLLP